MVSHPPQHQHNKKRQKNAVIGPMQLLFIISTTSEFNNITTALSKMDVLDNLTQLNQSIIDNLTWKPSICIYSSHFEQSLDNKINPNATNLNRQEVDVANFLDDSLCNSISLTSFRIALGYPPNAVLEIEGYLGLGEENNVLNMLKSAAAAGGTVLITNSVKTKRRRLVMFKIVAMTGFSHALSPTIAQNLSAKPFMPCVEQGYCSHSL